MQKARRHPDKSGLRPLVGVRFQVLFTPLFTVLFTFPSRYSFTIGLQGVFSLTGWCRQFQPGFLLSRPTQDSRLSIKYSPKGLSPSPVSLPRLFGSTLFRSCRSYNPAYAVTYTVWAIPRPLAATDGITICFLFLRVIRCFSSPRSLSPSLDGNTLTSQGGLPHSEICGSTRLCRSPQLIAAWHVLLRLLEPRHPPYALVHLNSPCALLQTHRVLFVISNHQWSDLHCIFRSTCQ